MKKLTHILLLIFVLIGSSYGIYYVVNSFNFSPKYDLVLGANVPFKVNDTTIDPIDITSKEIQNLKDLPSPKNSDVLSAVELKPNGIEIQNGVTVDFPLNEKLVPGTQLPIGYFDEESNRWLETGNYCYVDPSGTRARGTVYHFSIFGPLRTRIYLQERIAYNTEWMWILSQYGRMLDELNKAINEKYRSSLGVQSQYYVDIESWTEETDQLKLVAIDAYEMVNFHERRGLTPPYYNVNNLECLAAARAEFGSRKKKIENSYEEAFVNWFRTAKEGNVNSIVALWAASSDLLTFKQQQFGSLSSRASHYFKRKFIDAYVGLAMDFLKEKGDKFLEYCFKGKKNADIRNAISTVAGKRIGDPLKEKALEYLSDFLIDLNPDNLDEMSKKLILQADTLTFTITGVLQNPVQKEFAQLKGDIAFDYKYHTSHILFYAYPHVISNKRHEQVIYSPSPYTLTAEEIEDSYSSPVYRNNDITQRVIELNPRSVSQARTNYQEYKSKLKEEIATGITKWNEIDEHYQSDDDRERLLALAVNRLFKHDIDKFLDNNIDRFIKKHFIKFLTGNMEIPYLTETTGMEVPNVREIGVDYLVELLFKGAKNVGEIAKGVKKITGLFSSVFEDGLTMAWDFASPDLIKKLSEEMDKKSIKRALAINPLEVDKVFSRNGDLFDIIDISEEYPDACPPPEWKVLIDGDFHYEIDSAFEPEKEEYYSLYMGGEAKSDNEALELQGIDYIKVMIDVGVFGREHSIETYKQMVEYNDKEHTEHPEDLERYAKMGVQMTNWRKESVQNEVGTQYIKIDFGKYSIKSLYVIGSTIVEIRVTGKQNNEAVVKGKHNQILEKLKAFIPRMRVGRNSYDIFEKRFPGKPNPFYFTLTEEEQKERGITQ